MAAVRVVVGLGYGLATLLFLKNSDGVGDYISEIGRTTVHFWSRAKERTIGDGNARDLGELSSKLDRIASMKGETVHVHHGSNGAVSWVTTIVGGTAVVVIVAHVTGLFDFSGIMYVTQSKFKSATEALQESVAVVNKALQAARKDLLERMGLIETRIDNVSAELKDQITTSSAAVREDLAKVSLEVRDVGTAVSGMEDKLGLIEGGVGDLRLAMEKANRGIQLLCHVVAESYRYSSSNQKDTKWYSDLLTYSRNADLDNGGDIKQLKQNGEGPVMRLISRTNLGDSADNGAGGGGGLKEPVLAMPPTAPRRDNLARSLSEVIG